MVSIRQNKLIFWSDKTPDITFWSIFFQCLHWKKNKPYDSLKNCTITCMFHILQKFIAHFKLVIVPYCRMVILIVGLLPYKFHQLFKNKWFIWWFTRVHSIYAYNFLTVSVPKSIVVLTCILIKPNLMCNFNVAFRLATQWLPLVPCSWLIDLVNF